MNTILWGMLWLLLFVPAAWASERFIYNNEGIAAEEGLNLYLRIPINREFDRFSIHLEPLISINSETHGTIHKGYLRWKINSLSLDIGKASLWWGQGVHGGLFLTNNAAPLPMVRLFHETPINLPYLGAFQADIFMSRLEEERVVPSPYFHGVRFSFQPHSDFKVGLTRMMIMGGRGRPGLSPSRYGVIWFGENREGDQELSNSIAGLDFRWTTPTLEFYGEWGGEDEAGYLPSKNGYLAGLYFPYGFFKKGSRIEYADLTNPAWYVHGTYQSGYTYKKRLLGHHVGGGGTDLYFEQELVQSYPLRGTLKLDYEEQGITTQSVTERHYRIETDWSWESRPYTMNLNLAYEQVDNAGNTRDARQENQFIGLTITSQL